MVEAATGPQVIADQLARLDNLAAEQSVRAHHAILATAAVELPPPDDSGECADFSVQNAGQEVGWFWRAFVVGADSAAEASAAVDKIEWMLNGLGSD